MTALIIIAAIVMFLAAHDEWAEYQGHKDYEQHKKDHFEKYGRKLKRKQ